MPAGGPTYLRNADEPEYPAFKEPPEEVDYKLHVTGLREKRLWLLLLVMALLTILTIVVLALNIFMIRALGMSTRGMRSLQLHSRRDPKTGEEEGVIRFVAGKVHLGKVIARSGQVYGTRDKDLNVLGSRVVVSAGVNKSRLLLQDGLCRIENVEQFLVKGAESDRPFFSAQHPLFNIDRRVKKISTSQIITNKIRSPITEDLHVDVDDLIIRGNEFIAAEGKRINATAETSIRLQTSEDGALSISSKKLYIGSNWITLPVSSSPLLTATVDAMRVCLCYSNARGKLKVYLVAGNKQCVASPSFCR